LTAPTNGGVRVVVAEDEALIRMDLVEMLAEEGYDVVGQAATGEAAVALVDRLRPDVVLLDVRMPVMDGITAAETIAERHDCAIVMLTAFSERALVERAADAGAAAYLVKPVSAVHLIPAIEVARARRSEAAALSAEVESLEVRLAARKVIERAKGVLMRDYGLDEEGAFAWLRREAMDRRMSMAQVAAVVGEGNRN
jgi:response regulator NasT